MVEKVSMDALISELEYETSQIMYEISSLPYEDLELFVEKRQRMVDNLISVAEIMVPSSVHRARVSEVLKNDAAIMSRMDELRLEAQDWIRQRNQAKIQRNAYEGYSGAIDSILMDRRK